MPRYFFYLSRNGQIIPDPEGTELADINEARSEAFLNARDLIIQILRSDEPVPLGDNIHVVDEHGSLLHTVTFKDALG